MCFDVVYKGFMGRLVSLHFLSVTGPTVYTTKVFTKTRKGKGKSASIFRKRKQTGEEKLQRLN